MKTAIIVASAFALALSAGPSLAAKTHAKAGTSAEPKQPIPYGELNAYLKASPKQRATHDWWSGASTGMAANTAATGAASASTSATSSNPTAADEPKPTDAPAAMPKTDSPTPDPANTPPPPK